VPLYPAQIDALVASGWLADRAVVDRESLPILPWQEIVPRVEPASRQHPEIQNNSDLP
jgi:hypothetical protein